MITLLILLVLPFLTHQLIQHIHVLNELTANVLFAVAESHLSLGKAQRWGSCSHIEHHFCWDFDVVFLKGKKQGLSLFSSY